MCYRRFLGSCSKISDILLLPAVTFDDFFDLRLPLMEDFELHALNTFLVQTYFFTSETLEYFAFNKDLGISFNFDDRLISTYKLIQ